MNAYPNGIVLETINCPLCKESQTRHILKGRDMLHNIVGEFNVVECISCGLMRTNPRPTPETIGVYYPSDYAPYNSEVQLNQKKHNWKTKLKSFLGFDVKVLPLEKGSLYEVGCSNGTYLYEMQHSGWKIAGGLEYSDYSANLAREKGFNIETTSLEEACGPKEKVDILTAWMVIEHLHYPVDALKKITHWVKEDGYLVASIPFPSIFHKYFKELSYDLHLPGHLFHYSNKSLKSLLDQSGWDLINIRYQANPMTFLKSLRYLAIEKNYGSLKYFCDYMIDNPKSGKYRLILGWLLKITKQSGRIEFTATPIKSNK